ncbi:hypothetical protein SADUNF_Sadunf19G0024500 [Salix dunnii]|uniref:Uncharacterized protein n=1 Tax=Salix dunnii TaxID=1413687 RepID=A0A835J3H2_9ROSI|nr:hypothetical protein SADUNF_Sadunf19G0024500 [Salix dunnii]
MLLLLLVAYGGEEDVVVDALGGGEGVVAKRRRKEEENAIDRRASLIGLLHPLLNLWKDISLVKCRLWSYDALASLTEFF